jgi:exosortase
MPADTASASPAQPPLLARLHARGDLIAAALALGALWVLTWSQQCLEWQVNPLYSYGWAIPVLAGYLLLERLRDASAPRQAALRWLPALALPLMAAALVPLRVIHEANPDWVRINWLVTACALTSSFAVLAAWGGWRWSWHFAFPLLFTLTALPWPVWAEEAFTQGLMQLNTQCSAEGLSLCGIPALAQGNTIAVGRTVVDVEEACSGIRSLQTAFMMSLFLGEFYRLGFLRRIVLVVASFAVAFLLNMVRTITLTYVAGQSGPEALHSWHDPMGNFVMIGCIASLWGLATLVARGNRPQAFAGGPGASLFATPRLALAPFIVLIIGIIAAEATTRAWYGYHEATLPAPLRWGVDWPRSATDFQSTPFDERTVKLLKFTAGERAAWTDPQGAHWSTFYLRWAPGRVSKFLAGSHYPTVCFPASGLQLVQTNSILPVTLGQLTIPFRTYIFERAGERYYVFHGLVEERPSVSGETLAYRQVAADERIASALAGNRNLGQRVLGITISGVPDFDAAVANLRRNLPRLISIESSNP